jgi:alanine racemase
MTVTRTGCAQGAMLTVDLAALAANTRFFASRTKAEVMAVVKADGFGHGCVPSGPHGAGERGDVARGD